MRSATRTIVTLAILVIALPAAGADVPQLLNYQGYLADSLGSPLDTQVTIQFVIYDDSLAGTPLWQQNFTGVSIDAGRFQVLLGSDGSLDDSIFSGQNRFLGITVGADAEMAPRTRIVSVPYGLRSSTVVDNVLLVGSAADTIQLDPDEGLVLRATDAAGNERIVLRTDGAEGTTVTLNHPSGNYTTFGTGDSALCMYGSDSLLRVKIGMESAAPAMPGGGLAAEPAIAGGGAVSLYADGGLYIYRSVAAARGAAAPAQEELVLQFTPDGDIFATGRIAVGDNSSGSDVHSTVFGFFNTADGDTSTISGGAHNTVPGGAIASTIGGGVLNTAASILNTIGGGLNNSTGGLFCTIGGGRDNGASQAYATVAGGGSNVSSSWGATVAGGVNDTASGSYATVPGGFANRAGGDYSFAAGRRARAANAGTFVWADGTDADFTSSDINQFLVRAENGVGINLTDPSEDLDVNGTARLRGIAATVSAFNPVVVDGNGKLWEGSFPVAASAQAVRNLLDEREAEIQALKARVEDLQTAVNALMAAAPSEVKASAQRSALGRSNSSEGR